jgi:UDP-glucuronate 4-epimerase
MKSVLVTGAAGFIGFSLTQGLLEAGYRVVGIDSLTPYYDPALKRGRLAELGVDPQSLSYGTSIPSRRYAHFAFRQLQLEDRPAMEALFAENRFGYVVNLAAQAGVRYSLVNPHAYTDSNIVGFLNVLEGCRHYGVEHLVYASSSSVYGLNTEMPFKVSDNVDHPISLYAATKKSNELMAHTYSYLYDLPTTGLRFFTVYGPWGRPDMALFIFTRRILEGQPIEVYNHGHMRRDFTYIDDIVESVRRILPIVPPKRPGAQRDATLDPSTSVAPYSLYNIGNNAPVQLIDFVRAIEEALGIEAQINYMPLQAGDVPATYADVRSLYDTIDFRPQTDIREGIERFIEWYKRYYQLEAPH